MLVTSTTQYNFDFFVFKDTATTEIYTLSLHDALPISETRRHSSASTPMEIVCPRVSRFARAISLDSTNRRSEEHTSELQSRQYLVCRLLLEKKKTNTHTHDVMSARWN